MTSSESEGQVPSRKRSKIGGGEEGGSKKARGRPRVDTQDATAADRRRTQIRLAQRAYRQRKETTISSLKQQNGQLQSIIEEMNKSFLSFNESALKSGILRLNPRLGQELKNVAESLFTLAKTAASERNHEGDEETGEAGLDPATELHKATSSALASREQTQTHDANLSTLGTHTDIGWGYSATVSAESPTSADTNSPHQGNYGHSTYFPPMASSPYETTGREKSLMRMRPGAGTVGQVSDQSRTHLHNNTSSEQLPFGLVDLLTRDCSQYQSNPQIYSVNIPSPELTPPLSRLHSPPLLPSLSTKTPAPIYTYSQQETTFARRLTRAALECGFHLLSSATLRPAALNYVFKLSLPYMTVDQLREKFKLLLARGIHEDLDSYDTPFIHLGGAGTHYPRKDSQGNIIPVPNSWTVRKVGPMQKIRAQNTTYPSQTHDLDIDLTGFEGEWFDGHDVQGYLESEKGCVINPQDTFTEVFVEEEEEAPAGLSSLSYSKSVNLSLDLSGAGGMYPSQSPVLSNSSTTTAETLSSQSTPGTSISDPLSGRGSTSFIRSETPFGLDMGMSNFNDFATKFNDIDSATYFDQPLGLDLAPGFDVGLNGTTMTGFSTSGFGDMPNLGLDLTGLEFEPLPVVKQKRKRAAWLDVSKLIDEIVKHGVCLGRSPGFRIKDVDMAFKASLIHF
ncbi:uncharacterized protein BDR25DRAFT_334155 [Lindgomyces ingoldianus]|uniref:Uncharacterized protein n=1 Tax=Lindgomyces ingoldianus TaxID=673940 RepID=A0ACB6QVI8_9PLEO|nr:uncharacterized protein BDR25DRAFT_334155 [Lindgomyces ingoldianus]KAF2471003.1 hypothetical protein BDR25DRAFT_334155 [Lindgomyces ingoldianus]